MRLKYWMNPSSKKKDLEKLAISKNAYEFGPAPNPELHDPRTGEVKQLLSVATKSASFLTVYVGEAHPEENEDFKNKFEIKIHQNLPERLDAAKELLSLDELPSGPFLVDNMKDEASRAYGAQPERLYIILDGRIVYQGGVGPWLYDTEEVNSWLEKHFS